MKVLFAADGWDKWAPALRAACPEAELLQSAAPDSVDAIIYAPNGPGCDFAAYIPRPGWCKACGRGSSVSRRIRP